MEVPVTEAVVLAGGLGTRLRGAVPDLPKPLAPVAGRPFLAYLLDYLAMQGIRRVVLSVGYKHEAIAAAFGHRYGDIEIAYAIESEPLGTGGGIRLALQMVESPRAFVLNGDTLLELDYRDMAHAGAHEPLSIALRQVADGSRYGAAVIDNGRLGGFAAAGQGGPQWINGGIYLMDRTALDDFAPGSRFSFEADFLQARAPALRPLTVACKGRFIDIGVPDDYYAAQNLLPEWKRDWDTIARCLDAQGLWREPLVHPSTAPALFLDRDGVVIEEKNYLCDPAQVELTPGIATLINTARSLGMTVVEVTNQGGIGRGYFGWDAFVRVERRVRELLHQAGASVDAVFACPFHPKGVGRYALPHHPWRKPEPGMLHEAATLLGADLSRSILVGDKTVDVECARRAGLTRAVQVLTGHGPKYAETSRALATAGFHVDIVPTPGDAAAVLLGPFSDTLKNR